MKKKSEIQKTLTNKGLLQWEFKNAQVANKIVIDTANKLTQDQKLRQDLIKWHKELLDRRYSAIITFTNEEGRKAASIHMHGFDPNVIQYIVEFMEGSLQSKNYVSEKDFKKFVSDRGFAIEKITIKNEEEIKTLMDLNVKVEFL